MTSENGGPTDERNSHGLTRHQSAALAMAVGAIAVGAMAIGVLAIRRLAIKTVEIDRARIKSLEIADLNVTRLRTSAPDRNFFALASPTRIAAGQSRRDLDRRTYWNFTFVRCH